MTMVVWVVLGVVALVVLAVVAHAVESIGDRIAHGPGPRRRKRQDLRAEDAWGHRRNAGRSDAVDGAVAAALDDRKRGDASGLAGL